MGLAGYMKGLANAWLEPRNVRIISLAAERVEASRLQGLQTSGHFDRPVFPLLKQFLRCSPQPVLEAVRRYGAATARFQGARDESSTGYRFSNDYFSSPDAEVAYALLRDLQPKRLIEVGSGNSTQLFRAAIRDGGLKTELVSIDPFPRREVEGVADRVYRLRLEDLPGDQLPSELDSGDFLFIDSSHRIEAGNDVVNLLLNIVPRLKGGTIVHLHDIFLPFEYPSEWLIDLGWRWSEQYLVQALLQDSETIEVLWAGHYFQRTLSGFADFFPSMERGRASSLWMRRLG